MHAKIDLRPNQTIVFTGDSITDADRDLAPYRPLGFGYVHFAANFLLARYPHLNLNIINTGVGGNTIRDLQGRWRRDCLDHRPDILSVLTGINDLWWQYADSDGFAEGVNAGEYELTYKQLLSQVRECCDSHFVLIEPFMFCDDPKNQMFRGLRTYIDVVHKLAEEFDAVLVPLQTRIDEQIKHVPPEKWSGDLVHPYLWAHAWIAQRWLEATRL
ncbi:MAG: SGNH/GDSL hydrolase family protein [Planctomycetota bacterium]|jgi:lysophospholipase L1-like esterase